jgi:hypothetical protein
VHADEKLTAFAELESVIKEDFHWPPQVDDSTTKNGKYRPMVSSNLLSKSPGKTTGKGYEWSFCSQNPIMLARTKPTGDRRRIFGKRSYARAVSA